MTPLGATIVHQYKPAGESGVSRGDICRFESGQSHNKSLVVFGSVLC